MLEHADVRALTGIVVIDIGQPKTGIHCITLDMEGERRRRRHERFKIRRNRKCGDKHGHREQVSVTLIR